MLSLECKIIQWVQSFSSPWADSFFLLVSNRWAWIPFYLVLGIACFLVYRKKIIYILLSVVLLIALSDQLSVLIKQGVKRNRPCHTQGVVEWLRQPGGCGGMYGFVSSHAANSMALAVFLGFLLRRRQIWFYLLAGYTLLNGFSRIYLGAHFPSDILGGYLLGACLGISLLILLSRPLPFSGNLVVLPDEN